MKGVENETYFHDNARFSACYQLYNKTVEA